MPNTTFEYSGDPIEIVGGAPYAAGLGIIDIPMFEGFDPNNSVKHFRFKFHATQDVAESLYFFDISFYNSDMEDPDSRWVGTPIRIQDGWIGEAGESWGSGPEPENRTTFVSDHAHYGTTEGAFTSPTYIEVYEAQDGGTFWSDEVIDKATKEDRLPAGGDWFLRISLNEDSPGDVTLHDFSFEMNYQEYKPRNLIGPIPLTEGWVCSNSFPAPTELYLILHHGMAYMYGEMLDWNNWNEETEAPWFTNVYDDITTKLVDVGGIPEEARPAANTIVPIRFYDFDRLASVLGLRWELSINKNGSITFVSRPGQRPDALRLGGGDYSFAPMQVRWPLADQTHGPDTGPESGVIWEVHGEFVNEGESGGQTWEEDHLISLTTHGGITHLRGGAHHSASSPYDVPLWETGGVIDFDGGHSFDTAPILRDDIFIGQDFGFIQQFQLELADVPEGGSVQFDASSSTGSGLTYAWDFGDGTNGSGISPSHTYVDAGTYWVTLTVTDSRDRTDNITKRPGGSSSVDESYAGGANTWAANVNNIGAVINSAGQHALFMSGTPAQVFKGGNMVSGSIPSVPGDHFIGADDIDPYFDADKHFLEGGIRQAAVNITSPQMPWTTNSVIGRKYGTVLCLQPDGSHYRHQVECTAIPGGGNPNTYTHKLFKNIGGSDTQIGATVTNNDPISFLSTSISSADVEAIQWQPSFSGGVSNVNNNDVPKSGKWGYFVTSGVEPDNIQATGNPFPSYPPNGEVVNFDCWWPSEYEFDEFTP